MKQSVWSAGLVLVVQMTWAATALAQFGPAWATPNASTGVSLGQPVAGSPRTIPSLSVIVPVGYTAPATRLIAVSSGMAATSAGVTPSSWPSATYDPDTSEFAIDRATALPAPAPMPTLRTTVLIPAGAHSTDEVLPAPKTADPNAPIAATTPLESRLLPPPPLPMPGEPVAAGPTEVLPVELAPWYDPNRTAWYARGEFLLWWVAGYHVPPLASTSTNIQDGGILIPGNTSRVIFGDDTLNRGVLPGARFTVGYWCDCDEAIEMSGFFLGTNTTTNVLQGSQFPVLARPFFDVNRGVPFSELTSFPGQLNGNLTIKSPMNLWGLESNLRCNVCCWHSCDCAVERSYRVDLLGGFRYLNLDERLTLEEDILGLPTNPTPIAQNKQITVVDTFGTRNQFYGAQVGVDAEYRYGLWSFSARGKLAVGDTHETIQIDGSQRLVSLIDGTVQTFKGGLLALPGANIGTFAKDRFSVVPEITLTAGYQLSEHCRLLCGYNFMYWSNVVRPGDQIDTNLDVSKIPNFNTGIPADSVPSPGHPSVPFKTSDFWAQGVSIGLEFRY